MRILFFNYEYPPLGGGAANANFYIFKEYQKIPDLEVDFITSSIDEEYHLEKMRDKILIHRLPIGKNGKNLHYQSQKELLVYAWKAYWFSKKLVSQKKYDLSHSFFSVPCGFISWLLKRKYQLPYIVSLRGSDVPGYSERFTALYKILTPIIKMIWRGATAVVSNSQGLKELAAQSDPKQEISLIYNGIEINQFRPQENKTAKKTFDIFCISRVTERKGIKYLIEAVINLSEKYPQIRLKIVGEGDKLEELKSQIANHKLQAVVKFLGRVEHDQTPALYREADVFVLPSLNEGMSNTMLEALASGLPLIATDTGGTRELLQDGENGWIVRMKDSGDIAEKIEKIMKDESLKGKMGTRSRQLAESMSWEKVAEKYHSLYNDIIGK